MRYVCNLSCLFVSLFTVEVNYRVCILWHSFIGLVYTSITNWVSKAFHLRMVSS